VSDRLNHSGSYPVGRREPRYVAPVEGLHQPMRPSWDCSACAAPWPCQSKRGQLLAQYTGAQVSLGLLMGVQMCDASRELTQLRAGELHQRFLGWIRTGRRNASEPGG
jgi:hypothetical protein